MDKTMNTSHATEHGATGTPRRVVDRGDCERLPRSSPGSVVRGQTCERSILRRCGGGAPRGPRGLSFVGKNTVFVNPSHALAFRRPRNTKKVVVRGQNCERLPNASVVAPVIRAQRQTLNPKPETQNPRASIAGIPRTPIRLSFAPNIVNTSQVPALFFEQVWRVPPTLPRALIKT